MYRKGLQGKSLDSDSELLGTCMLAEAFSLVISRSKSLRLPCIFEGPSMDLPAEVRGVLCDALAFKISALAR